MLKNSFQILKETGFTVLKSIIYDRQCVMDTPGQQATVWHRMGKPAKTAAFEFEQLFQEVLGVLYEQK